jgi:hypothetical protein
MPAFILLNSPKKQPREITDSAAKPYEKETGLGKNLKK